MKQEHHVYFEKCRSLIDGMRVETMLVDLALYTELKGRLLDSIFWRNIQIQPSVRASDPDFHHLHVFDYDISMSPFVYRNRNKQLVYVLPGDIPLPFTTSVEIEKTEEDVIPRRRVRLPK